MDYKFTDLVDIIELQDLVSRFDRNPDLSFTLIDADENILISSEWMGVCPGYHGIALAKENNCSGNKISIGFIGNTKNEYHLYACDSGLVSIEIPIFFEGNYLATVFSGQFFLDEPDVGAFNKQEDCPLLDSDSPLLFLPTVPVLGKDDIEDKIDCFCRITELLLSRGFGDFKLEISESQIELYEKKLAENNERLKSLEKMKSDLISSFSHELKTPLSIIKGYNELLYDGCLGDIDVDQKKALDTSLHNINKLERIVDSLLYLGMEHSNEHFYESQPLNILDIIEAATVSLTKSFKSKNLKLQTNVPGKVSVIYGDSRKLFQVLNHLLDNAIKFSPTGSTITISVTETTDLLHLRIQDRGVGIIEEQLSRIFDGFYQGDASLTRKFSGVGLGLNICQRIIEHHQGKIRVESKINEGSTFHIELPVKNSFTNGTPL